ncbi:MAG: ATP-binding protein [Kofleriaceae bacterium]|nr:ATP-binding protein [Kofleriaceae bacterium]
MTAASLRPLIVYVDDEKTNRVVFTASMGDFNVKTADGGAAALELLATEDVAVLITDIRMPGMTGEELLRIVKQKYPSVIRMVITAHEDLGPILRAINEGLVVRYIVKPWDRAELTGILRWAVEAHTFGRNSATLQRRLMETERLATLGTIAGLLVHDLRQPLMSMMVNIEHLSNGARDAGRLAELVRNANMPADVRDRLLQFIGDLQPTLADLTSSTEHLSTLTAGLRDLGRPASAAAGGSHGSQPIDPLPLVRQAIAVCQDLTFGVRSAIVYEGARTLPRISMTSTELVQVLINVIDNAAQAVSERGEQGGKVTVNAYADGDALEIVVADTGAGMPPDVLARAGTPFFTTRKEGTGLGIAQCQRLVGEAGGRFKLESTEGIGTTVTLRLPIAR